MGGSPKETSLSIEILAITFSIIIEIVKYFVFAFIFNSFRFNEL